jgi:hypothetical protein
VKRAPAGARRAPSLPAAILLLAFASNGVSAQEDPRAWVEEVRQAARVPTLAFDGLLSETAAAWARAQAEAGTLSHRGADGSTALDRYRMRGGTDIRVGEIIGAGPSLAEVERAWMRSDAHRNLVRTAAWTHMGWGSASYAAGERVWVVLFCVKLVEGLTIEPGLDGLSVNGAFVAPEAREALLYSGLQPMQPATWDARERRFTFLVPTVQLAGYLRLGYLDASGGFVLTNALTWPPGTGFREAGTRSEAPAPLP